jgi:hypothetical protein
MTLSPALSLQSHGAPLKASKWLSSPVLIDFKEMEALCAAIEPFYLYPVGSVMPLGDERKGLEPFLSAYGYYIDSLQKGELPDEERYRSHFSSVFTVAPECLFAIPVGEGQQVVRIAKPVVQLQMHRLHYSEEEGKFRSMTFGSETILWGIQFSYPQLYQDLKTNEAYSVGLGPMFPNTALFRKIQQWIRHNTAPTPMRIGEAHVNIPMRLGKNCFSWINSHPQLIARQIHVASLRKEDDN